MTIPPLYTFFAPAEVLPETQAGTRPFTGVAYSGGVITDHGGFIQVAFDLATLTLATPAPLLLEHDREDTIGVIASVTLGDALQISGQLFTGLDADAAAVAAKADAGFPWQLSVGIFPGVVETIEPGQAVPLNGQTLTGPLTVFRNACVREVSFCAVGADRHTSATVFTTAPDPSFTPPEPIMADTTDDSSAVLDALRGQLAATEQTLAERDATIAALQRQIEQFHAAQRDSEIKALFAALDREFTAEAAQPYQSMTGAQFAAISADLKALRPTPSPHLFSAVATGSRPDVDARQAAAALNAQVAGVQ